MAKAEAVGNVAHQAQRRRAIPHAKLRKKLGETTNKVPVAPVRDKS